MSESDELTTVDHIVIDILQELEGRKGLGISGLDEETQQDITDKFLEITREHVKTERQRVMSEMMDTWIDLFGEDDLDAIELLLRKVNDKLNNMETE